MDSINSSAGRLFTLYTVFYFSNEPDIGFENLVRQFAVEGNRISGIKVPTNLTGRQL